MSRQIPKDRGGPPNPRPTPTDEAGCENNCAT